MQSSLLEEDAWNKEGVTKSKKLLGVEKREEEKLKGDTAHPGTGTKSGCFLADSVTATSEHGY